MSFKPRSHSRDPLELISACQELSTPAEDDANPSLSSAELLVIPECIQQMHEFEHGSPGKTALATESPGRCSPDALATCRTHNSGRDGF